MALTKKRIAAIIFCLLFFISACGLLERTWQVEESAKKVGEELVQKTKEVVVKTKEGVKKKVKETVEDNLNPQKVFGKDAVTLIFFGLDKNEERVKTLGSFRTDTIIVFRIDFANKHVGMLSIPRDTYVPIANRDYSDKINHAFPFGGGIEGGGFENSVNTVAGFLGAVPIDNYFASDMTAIAPVVDAIGGVEFYVDVTYNKRGFNLKEGLQLVDGKTAQQYVRFRYSKHGDIDRVQRQQKFLIALMKDMNRKMDLDGALAIYRKVKKYTYTDLTMEQIMSLAYFFRGLDPEKFERYYVHGSFMNKNGISYWKPDMDYVEEIVDKLGLNEEAGPAPGGPDNGNDN